MKNYVVNIAVFFEMQIKKDIKGFVLIVYVISSCVCDDSSVDKISDC